MSTGERIRRSDGRARTRSLAVFVAVVVLGVAVIAFGLVATGNTSAQTAGANGNAPPELAAGEKLNTTAVEVLFADDAGVDTSSIAVDDFLLNNGDLSHARASSEGTNASVTLVLTEPIPEEELTVGIATGSDITDVNGTQIRTDGDAQTVTVDGMDGVPPRVLGTDVGDAIGGPAAMEFRFDEPISDLDVNVTGPENTTLGIDDFENPLSNRYVAGYEPPESGEYRVSLSRVTDRAGNVRNVSVVRTIEADRSDPEAVIGIDFGASSARNVTFDGSQSAGDRLAYTWDLGDGTSSSGEQVSHEFTRENQTVTLTVEDGFGNTDRDHLDLNLTDGLEIGESVSTENGSEAPAIIVDRDRSNDSRSSLVSVTGALAGESLDIGSVDDSERPLLRRNSVALDRLSVTPAMNASFSLALAAADAGDVTDSAAGESVPVGGFTALSNLRTAEISSVEFAFAISAERLDALDLSPADIELRREVDGEWEGVDTTVLSNDSERHQFAATTSGFSRFAIVGVDGKASSSGSDDNGSETNESASIDVTDATLDATDVETGEAVGVTATVENQRENAGTFRAGLELDGGVVDTRDVDVAANDSETLQFNRTVDEPGTVTVAVNGTVAGELTVAESNETEDDVDVDEDVFSVANVTLNESSIDPGESVVIEGAVENGGEETADFVAELEVDGDVVDTYEAPQVPGGGDVPVSFTRQFDEKGTYSISISGNESASALAVGQEGFLGFLPLGLLRTALALLGVPVLFVYLGLKAAAFYLGY